MMLRRCKTNTRDFEWAAEMLYSSLLYFSIAILRLFPARVQKVDDLYPWALVTRIVCYG